MGLKKIHGMNEANIYPCTPATVEDRVDESVSAPLPSPSSSPEVSGILLSTQ
jgi:hypothetical protein